MNNTMNESMNNDMKYNVNIDMKNTNLNVCMCRHSKQIKSRPCDCVVYQTPEPRGDKPLKVACHL